MPFNNILEVIESSTTRTLLVAVGWPEPHPRPLSEQRARARPRRFHEVLDDVEDRHDVRPVPRIVAPAMLRRTQHQKGLAQRFDQHLLLVQNIIHEETRFVDLRRIGAR